MSREGTMRLGPSHPYPPNGLANVCEPIAVVYVPAPTFVNSNDPSAAVFVDCTVFPDASCSWTVTPGSPSSPFSTTPGLPPPGLKSRQTVPTMSLDFVAGSTACTELFGT